MKPTKEMLNEVLETVKRETVPAIGCTEPVAVALACVEGAKHLNGQLNEIHIKVSRNIFKNGKSVMIPNTGTCGLKLAGALGAICGNPDDCMCVFKNVNEEFIKSANKMIENDKVSLISIDSEDKVYVEVDMNDENDNVHVILSNSHSHITLVELNGRKIYEDFIEDSNEKAKHTEDVFKILKFSDLREYAETIDIKDIDFINDGIKMNMEAAEKGLSKDKGLTWGKGILSLQKNGKISSDASMRARILTAAGADIRMSGGLCPIMTSGGSGNQGLNVVIPAVVVAQEKNIENEKLVRSIFFGHCVNNYVKHYTGKLSSMCGCSIASGIGASAAVTWMLGGDDSKIQGAVNNMLADLTGMLCDGAKETCALKLSTSAAEAILCAYMALDNIIVPLNTGIIGDCVEDTIKNIGILCHDGMANADGVLVDIIEKQITDNR